MTKPFTQWTEFEQDAIVKDVASRWGTNDIDTIKRCFSLAGINLTIDYEKDFYRIEDDGNAKVCKLLISEYMDQEAIDFTLIEES